METEPEEPKKPKYIVEITNRYLGKRYFQSESLAEAKQWRDDNYVEKDKQAIIFFDGEMVSIS